MAELVPRSFLCCVGTLFRKLSFCGLVDFLNLSLLFLTIFMIYFNFNLAELIELFYARFLFIFKESFLL